MRLSEPSPATEPCPAAPTPVQKSERGRELPGSRSDVDDRVPESSDFESWRVRDRDRCGWWAPEVAQEGGVGCG